ncbi:hypothetical protein ACH5RR_038697 [Cinchona calisaya]|uniref:Uncharacterized protein n=1 Tax=Cinchona calisaya TaxID=153742 RepID=A0ABD2XW21_9GENT
MDFSSSSQQHQPPPPPGQQFQQPPAQPPEQQFQQAAYGPSEIQPYYYPTYYQNYQNPPQIQDYSSFYNTQFVNGYDQQHQQTQYSQPESAGPVAQPPPPGVSVQPEPPPPQPAESGGVDQQNGYYPTPGLDPAAAAAVAALAQITQIAGTLGGFQGPQQNGYYSVPGFVSGSPGPEVGFNGPRPKYPRGGRSHYRGGGRRGGGSFRGRGRGRGKGNIGNHPPKTGGSSNEMGCVQRMGGSGNLQQHGASSSHSEPSAASENVESKVEVAESLTGTNQEEAKPVQPQTQVPPSVSAVTNQQPTRGARCELCKVDCNSMEILEQHKNGKRHQKNLRKSQQLDNASRAGAGKCKVKKPCDDSNPEVALKSEISKEGEENKDGLPENLPTNVVGDSNNMEIQQSSNKAEKPHSSGNTQSDCLVSQPGNQMHGLKRKMKGGRGGKRVKTGDTSRGSLKPQRPKIVIPFVCDLCNVRCDTKEVFDHHLSGKKHISKLKRFEAHQAMYGPLGLQALYPPSSIAQNLFHQQRPQTFYSPQTSYLPLGTDVPPPGNNAIPAATGTVSELVHNPNPQLSNGTPQFGCSDVPVDTEQQAALAQPETKQGA